MITCANRDKWIAALLSGEYEQGKNALQFKEKFCCLGVYAEVLGLPKRKLPDGHVVYKIGECDGISTIPPDGMGGLSYEECNILADKNDDGMTFSEIARYIKNEIPCEP